MFLRPISFHIIASNTDQLFAAGRQLCSLICINNIYIYIPPICYAEARNLENSKEVEDPILPKLSDKEKPHMISGELPWDRYYGNYLSLKIEYNEKPTIKINIPVRVLHSVRDADIENIDDLYKEKYKISSQKC